MRSIFVTDKSIDPCEICEVDNISRVYSESARAYLKDAAGLNEIYSYEEIVSSGKPLDDVEFIFSTWGMQKFSEDEIAYYFPGLRALFYGAGSVKSFAEPFLKRGVEVISAYAANGITVAEFTVAEILLATKGFFYIADKCRENNWTEARIRACECPGNYKTKIGIIGAGMIGKCVIRLLGSYVFDILVCDPYLPDATARELGVKKASLEEIFRECTVVSNHLPDLDSTKQIIRRHHFDSMQKNAVFINTGRSAQLIESELIDALRERPDITALLDVLDNEPPKPDSPLLELPNAVLTPHMAGAIAKNERQRLGDLIVEEFDRYMRGEHSPYSITLEMLKIMA